LIKAASEHIYGARKRVLTSERVNLGLFSLVRAQHSSFYIRDDSGIPTVWVKQMRESMAQLTPRFSAGRAVQTYTEQYYLPAATAYRDRTASNGAVGQQIVAWQHSLEQQWNTLRFGDMKVVSNSDTHTFTVEVAFGTLDPARAQVELYANGGDETDRKMMACDRSLSELSNSPLHSGFFSAHVPATRPHTDYTARILPHNDQAAIPLEDAYILWQR